MAEGAAGMLTLNEYKNIIDLQYRPRPYTVLPEKQKSEICDELLSILLEERNEIAAFSYPYPTKRDLIWGYLNRRPPNPVSAHFLELQDALFRSETAERGMVDASSFEYRDGLSLWQGDITRLQIDAVVTAANKFLLGCFIPHHHCIDNAIHSRAGVQVRLDGSRIIGAQGEPEPAGCAKVTLAYNLPSKYILHTIGPMTELKVTDENRRTLRSCYISCLNLAREMQLKSVAFCCIGTGGFSFPNDEAAAIAVGAVKNWLLETGYDLRVVFDVFLDKDLALYQDILRNS